ncbi:unnamed protein product [Rhizoctonia solani]|uniref:Uncharacterized protein n=1 Tax=Rhizoctonia solani TaxID=456999 RepID=A0A8H3CXV4_9AGAM|nr:unnamed protein product [Rhizoctonia solani]
MADGSARRGPRPSADPFHIAKRKKLIAEEFAYNGTHSAIKKTISWGDIGRHGTESPSKRARTSLSQSITPGLSDMSTPTPINRPRSSLKTPNSQKSILVSPRPRPNTQSKRESIGRSASILQQSQPDFTFRAPKGPALQRPQSQPEVINLISDETPQSDKNSNVPGKGDKVARAPNLSASQATQSPQIVDPPAPVSPTSDAGTQYREQDILDDNQPGLGHILSPRPNNAIVSQKRPADHSSPHATNAQSSFLPTSPSRRKRRTSEIGIQTISDKEVDWLGDLDLDDSVSAVEISRVWADRRSGSKAADAGPGSPEPEPEEPLTGNFLDEFEGRSVNNEEEVPGDLGDTGDRVMAEVPEEHDKSDEQDDEGRAVDQEGVPGRVPASSRASSPLANPTSSQGSKPSANIVSQPPPVSSPLRFPTSPPYESIPDIPQSSVQPYPFNLQERKPLGASGRSQKDTNGAQVDVQPRPFSSSQPNPFAAGPRARSRLYTPQPAPPTRNRNLNELRAAPTLGRSTLEGSQPAVDLVNSADATSSRAESDDASKRSGPKAKTLKAAPTLGRSTDWGHVSPARPVTADSNETNGPNLGHQPTDYDAEYGSVPEAPSSLPSRPPSSPAPHHWEVESMHASTPHRLVTRMSPLAQDLTREAKSTKATSLADSTQPLTLAALEKRRRSSVAPLAESKKIRREYDTVESITVPNLRAHKDTYDESGRRTWIPQRPSMKRALDAPGPGIKKVVGPKYPAPVAEESEPAEEARGQVLPESVLESRAETFEPVPYGESMQEHQMELDGETADKAPRPSTEIAETPQSTRIRDPFDLTTSELQSRRFTSEPLERVVPPKPIDYAYVLPPIQSGASIVRENEPPVVNDRQKGEPTLAPVVEPITPGSQVKPSQSSRSDGRPTKKVPSKSKRRSSGLHITPGRQPVWSPPRTRLSMGGRSGISVLQVSKSDQEILVQAGLRPILKRLSQAHGFTVDVVAGVYQETGSLKDTENTLEKMKHSAERTRVSISRRKSTLEVLHGEGQDFTGRDSSEVSDANNDYLNWDTSRMSSRILFGEGLS